MQNFTCNNIYMGQSTNNFPKALLDNNGSPAIIRVKMLIFGMPGVGKTSIINRIKG